MPLALLLLACTSAPPSGPGPGDDLGAPDLAPPSADLAPPCAPGGYPAGPYGVRPGEVLSAELLPQDQRGAALGEVHAPCGQPASLLVLRLGAPWCGPCQLAAAQGAALLGALPAGRILLLEVMATDELNAPGSDAALARFAATLPAGSGRPARHPRWSHELLPRLGLSPGGGEHLPLVLVVDRRTMKIVARLADPDDAALRHALRQALAQLDGQPPPTPPAPVLRDGRFSPDRWALIQAMALPADLRPPPDPTNRVADDAAARELGRALFNDTVLGGVGLVSCSFCHRAVSYLADMKPTGVGIDPAGRQAVGDRNTPWLGTAAFDPWLLWDGRADSLWMQALGPLENDKEFASNRLRVVRRALASRGAEYQRVFGAPPDLSDMTRFPADGRPGTPAWEAMAAADRATVNRVFADLGKAIAAFERGIRPQPVALDRYAAGQSDALTEDEKDGLLRFFELGCAQCHHGPFLRDGAFHALGFATGRQDGQPDRGRRGGLAELSASEFRGDGPFSDDPAAGAARRVALGLADDPILEGQVRTPSLRGVADTGPYGHGGTYADLAQVVQVLASGGDGAAVTAPGRDPALVRFDPADPRNARLIAFLQILRGAVSMP